MFRKLALPLFLLLAQQVFGQHQELDEAPNIWGDKTEEAPLDTTTLLDVFRQGSIHGHFRYFFSFTDNSAGLTDWYANAAGGGIRFETAKYHGFQLAVSGFYIFNLASSNFTIPDAATGAKSRYEIGLFNIEDFSNTQNLDRLEEFYIKYNYRKSEVVFGKQLLNTPFINLQDGRMRPTAVQGLYINMQEWKKMRIQAAFLNGMAPRSTIRYMGVGESIGIYPTGVNPDGTSSGYRGNVASDYIAIAGITHRPTESWSLQAWNVFVDNVFNTMLLQNDVEWPTKKDAKLLFGAQIIRQNRVGNGGNKEDSQRYMTHQAAMSFGARLGVGTNRWEYTLNYNRITKEGRYTMPREWGRDPFYTFLPRERNEGFSDLHALMARVAFADPARAWRISLGSGYYRMPDVLDFERNKYGMPAYIHTNLDVRYAFAGFWKGLEAQLLVVHKAGVGNTHGNLNFVINKVDMFLYNFVLNYRF